MTTREGMQPASSASARDTRLPDGSRRVDALALLAVAGQVLPFADEALLQLEEGP